MGTTTTITPNPGLYATVFFECNPDAATLQSYEQAASDIAGSGFTFVNLWFSGNGMHVDVAGNFRPTPAGNPAFVSGGALTSGYAYVPQLLSTLTGSGSSVKALRMTFGGWLCDNTFNCIVDLFNRCGTGPQNPLYANFMVLQELGVTGIDLDLEPGGNTPYFDYPYYIGPFSQLITMVAGLGLDVTFCPYQNENFWLTLLAAVFTQNGGAQPVKQMNLQCYSGGSSNTQAQWVAAVNEYYKLKMGLNALNSEVELGISDPASFIVPGFGGANDGVPVCPPGIQQQLTAAGFAVAGVSGAYIFDYANVQTAQQNGDCAPDNTTSDYANALIAGINAVNGAS
jgi:hypothetical protein